MPPGHGCGVVAPSTQRKPRVQLEQAVLPRVDAKVPARQSSQVARLPNLAKVPPAHGVGSREPVGAKKPGSAAVHSPALARLVALEKLPSRHGRGADAPSGQKEPPSHGLHSVAAVSF